MAGRWWICSRQTCVLWRMPSSTKLHYLLYKDTTIKHTSTQTPNLKLWSHNCRGPCPTWSVNHISCNDQSMMLTWACLFVINHIYACNLFYLTFSNLILNVLNIQTSNALPSKYLQSTKLLLTIVQYSIHGQVCTSEGISSAITVIGHKNWFEK